MSAYVLVANHGAGHWALDFLLFMTPAILLGAVLWAWQRRDRAKRPLEPADALEEPVEADDRDDHQG